MFDQPLAKSSFLCTQRPVRLHSIFTHVVAVVSIFPSNHSFAPFLVTRYPIPTKNTECITTGTHPSQKLITT